jgi:ankyrin repeat protein
MSLSDLFSTDNLSEIRKHLKENPGFNINENIVGGWTPLHFASFHGHHEVVTELLAHPRINVNCKDNYGSTPFQLCSEYERVEVVKLLLKDSRVDITVPDIDGWTPLWCAAERGAIEVLRWLVASGRDLKDLNRKGRYGTEEYTAIEVARREKGRPEVVTLLERFVKNQGLTRGEVRKELGISGNNNN